jgi:putative transposase
MPRRIRIVAAGYSMHVILRGINRAAIFFDDSNDRFFLDSLSAGARQERVAVHAYVLMSNHVHLLMTPVTTEGVPQVMKRVVQRYVQYINRTYQRTGALFEGRFRFSLIDADAYLLACQRYIELNPVRAGMVAARGEYPWSSYQANALSSVDPVLTPLPLYLALGDSAAARCAAYRCLFEMESDAELLRAVRDTANGGFVLGNERFAQQIAAMVGRRTWKGSPGRPCKRDDDAGQDELPV